MNYIKKLQEEVKRHNESTENVYSVICELYAYMNSSKFNCGDTLDNYINVSDVRNYLYRIRKELYLSHEN